LCNRKQELGEILSCRSGTAECWAGEQFLTFPVILKPQNLHSISPVILGNHSCDGAASKNSSETSGPTYPLTVLVTTEGLRKPCSRDAVTMLQPH